MNRRFFGILIILAGLIIIIGVIYAVFFYDFDEPAVESDDIIIIDSPGKLPLTDRLSTEDNTAATEIKKPIGKPETTSEDLKRMASSFAERFGSYSNHSNYNNIVDLKIFMTANMQAWADDFVAEARAGKDYANIYYGLTTKSLSQVVKNFDPDKGVAEILVKTQRRESIGTMSNSETTYEDIIINFVKIRGSWKVDSAYWQE